MEGLIAGRSLYGHNARGKGQRACAAHYCVELGAQRVSVQCCVQQEVGSTQLALVTVLHMSADT